MAVMDLLSTLRVAVKKASPNRVAALRRAQVFIAAAFLPGLSAYAAEPEARLVDVRMIWNKAEHNAFTDLIRFKGQWFCVFREGKGHVSAAGKLRVITSPDGMEWVSAALIEKAGVDLRDAKITVTPGGELMLSGAAAFPQPATFKHQSMTWFSSDGRNWSEAHDVGDKDVWLWRTTWHGDRAFGVGYGTNKKQGILRLYESRDGKSFDTLVPQLLEDSYPNETSIIFRRNGDAHCLLRRDGKEKSALLGIASPPYRDWTWKDLGVRGGGPHMIEIPDGRTVAAVRLYDGGARTSLCWLDPEAGTLVEFLKLPSGGDTSYAGLVWHEDELWISYYSSHERKKSHATSSIYLARVAIPSPAGK